MASLAATRVFAAGGRRRHRADRLGDAPRRAWTRRTVADRTITFLVLSYVVYTPALVVFGFGLRLGHLPRQRAASR